jgi:hypothetical protein
MKAFHTAVVFGTLLGTAVAASAQVNMPQPGLPGSSPDFAVRIVATSDLMIDRYVSRWLRTHYPGWDADPIEYQEIGPERYAVVYITSPNNPGRRVYFRIQGRMNEPDDDGAPFPL